MVGLSCRRTVIVTVARLRTRVLVAVLPEGIVVGSVAEPVLREFTRPLGVVLVTLRRQLRGTDDKPGQKDSGSQQVPLLGCSPRV